MDSADSSEPTTARATARWLLARRGEMRQVGAALLLALWRLWQRARPVSAFEKALAANSAIIVIETGVGYWITQHNPETYHYLIDTSFIALAALLGVVVNFFVLRASFAPLSRALEVIRAVERGDLKARAPATSSDPEAQALATTFNHMLDQLEQARDEATRQVVQAHEAERRRVALELHDQIGQSLTALTLHAQALSRRLGATPGDSPGNPPGDPRAAAQAQRLAELAQRTLAEAQALAHDLRPTLLDDAGLPAALRALASEAHERLGVQTRLDLDSSPVADDPAACDTQRLPGELETALFRIAQEALTNAARHGHARHARIRLRRRAGQITLLICDDGQGFDPHARLRRGLGLPGMRERAHLVGGGLRVRTHPGKGCVIWAYAPLAPLTSLAPDNAAVAPPAE